MPQHSRGLSAAVIREKNTFMLEAGVVVLADQGIACLHPQSTVLLDGKVVEIDRLAETLDFIPIEAGDGRSEVATMRSSVVSFREDSLSTGTGQATRMRRRRHSGEIIRIKLRSGFEQAVTPDHLFLDGNSLEWKEAGKFATGDYLTAPQSIPGERAGGAPPLGHPARELHGVADRRRKGPTKSSARDRVWDNQSGCGSARHPKDQELLQE